MSAASARRLATASTLTLALALATPAAAFAQNEDPERGKSSTAQQDKDKAKAGSGSSSTSTGGSTGTSGSGSKAGSSSSKAGKGAGAGGKAGGGDPAGNNGTVKIDDAPFDETPGNEPHVGCTFQIDFFGFDAGDRADVTLTGHAPTGGGLLWSTSNRLISTDAAGGGQDVDESITLTLGDLNLAGATPHPKQGYHVKLAADVVGAPGGAKQKVFWIRCATPTVSAASAPTSGGAAPTLSGTTTAPATGGAATGVFSARSVERSAPELTLGSGTAVSGTTAQAATSGRGATSVSANGAVRPTALPFTGVEGLAYLLALGAAAIGLGTLAHRLGRRRATV